MLNSDKYNSTYPTTTTLTKANFDFSGKYKVCVDKDNNLFFDDYCGSRKEIDINGDFLSQVSNFLKSTSTVLIDDEKKNYGFDINRKNIINFHTPLFISDDFIPNYSVLGQFLNFDNLDNKFNNTKLIKFFNFKDIGLKTILEDIHYDYDYNHSVFLNLAEEYIEIHGYSIDENCYTSKKFNSQEYQTLLTDSNKLHEYIGQLFKQTRLINPRFINLQFEIENYITDSFNYRQFFGFISNGNISDEIKNNHVNIDTFNNQQVFEIKNNFHYDIIHNGYVDTLISVDKSIKLKFDNINVDDELVFFNSETNEEIFKYVVTENDISENLNLTLQKIKRQIDYNSKFLVEYSDNVITLFSNYAFDVYVDLPIYVKSNTKNNEFIAIGKYDIKLIYDIPISDIKIFINDIEYKVLYKYTEIIGDETFTYYKLDLFNNYFSDGDKLIVKHKIKPTYYNLNSINHNDYGIKIEYNENCNKKEYIEFLNKKFPNKLSIGAANSFDKSILKFVEPVPFVDVDKNITKNTIELNETVQVAGSTSYCLPNILNYDKQFYIENNSLYWHWFLINSEVPEYIKGDARNRFVGGILQKTPTSEPTLDNVKLFSKLKSKNKYSKYCECIFLGVRYLMDYRLNNYKFAVVHMPNKNRNNNETDKYTLHVNHEKRECILMLNKFLLFVDLIRGGEIENDPIIDLSLYYTVDKLYTSNPNHIKFITKLGGLLLADEKIPVLFKNSNLQTGWRHFDTATNKTYICLKNNVNVNIVPLPELLPKTGDAEFYHYNYIEKFGKIIAIKYKLINIVENNDNYIWCENLIINFFEADNLFFNENEVDIAEFSKIENYTVLKKSNNKIEIKVKITKTTPLGNQYFEKIIFDPSESLNFKEDYYECAVNDMSNIFKFDESIYSNSEIYKKLKNNLPLALSNPNNNDKYLSEKITMFHRNQLWFLNKHLIANNAYFKYDNFKQIRKQIKDLTVEKLNLYSKLHLIKSENEIDKAYKIIITDKDVGLSFWDKKVTKILRNRGLFRPLFKEKSLDFYKLMCYTHDIEINVSPNDYFENKINYKKGLELFLENKKSEINFENLISKYYKLDRVEVLINNKYKSIDYKFSNKKDYLIINEKYLNNKIKLIFTTKNYAK